MSYTQLNDELIKLNKLNDEYAKIINGIELTHSYMRGAKIVIPTSMGDHKLTRKIEIENFERQLYEQNLNNSINNNIKIIYENLKTKEQKTAFLSVLKVDKKPFADVDLTKSVSSADSGKIVEFIKLLPEKKRDKVSNIILKEAKSKDTKVDISPILDKKHNQVINSLKIKHKDDSAFIQYLENIEYQNLHTIPSSENVEKRYSNMVNVGKMTSNIRLGSLVGKGDNYFSKAYKQVYSNDYIEGVPISLDNTFYNGYSLVQNRKEIQAICNQLFNQPQNNSNVKLFKKVGQLLDESGIFDKDYPYSIDEVKQSLAFGKIKNATEQFLKMSNGSKQDVIDASKELELQNKNMEWLYSKLPSFNETDGIYLNQGFLSSDVSSKFTNDLVKNGIVNQVFMLKVIAQNYNIDFDKLMSDPSLLMKTLATEGVGVFKGYMAGTENGAKLSDIASDISEITPLMINPDACEHLKLASNLMAFTASDGELALIRSNALDMAELTKNFIDLTYGNLSIEDKISMIEGLLAVKDEVSIAELNPNGEINPFTGKVTKNAIDVKFLARKFPHEFGKGVLDKSCEMYKEYLENISDDKDIINPSDMSKAVQTIANKRIVRLEKLKETPERELELKQLDNFIKDPVKPFENIAKSLAKTAVVLTGNVNPQPSVSPYIANGLSEFFKRDDKEKEKEKENAEAKLIAERKMFKNRLYVLSQLETEEKTYSRSNEQFCRDIVSLRAVSDKLAKEQKQLRLAGKMDKAMQVMDKLQVIDLKIGAVQSRELTVLEQGYKSGRIPECYFRARVEQVMTLNTEDKITFLSSAQKSEKNLIEFHKHVDARVSNNAPVEKERFADFYSNIMTVGGNRHGNEMEKKQAKPQSIASKTAKQDKTKDQKPKDVNANKKQVKATEAVQIQPK